MDLNQKCQLVAMCCFLFATTGSGVHSAICESIKIPMCSWLPYNLTHMPNLLFHSAQRNAQLDIEQYQPLVDTNCSEDLLFFLCTMFAPMCPMGFRQDVVIPPCQGVCKRARAGCEPIMNYYNYTWPSGLSCDNLPKYDRGVCLSPESIIATTGIGSTMPQTSPLPLTPPPLCDCAQKKPEKLKSAFTSGKYHFAMKAQYRRAELLPDGALVLHVVPEVVFFYRRVAIPQVARLWVREGCLCERLREGNTYLVMGKEKRRLNKLLFGSGDYVDKWREKTVKRIRKWTRKLVQSTTKHRGRHNKKGKHRNNLQNSQRRKSRDRNRKTSQNIETNN